MDVLFSIPQIKYKDIPGWINENMVIVCDTREKANGHIIDALSARQFHGHRGKYAVEGLKTGDYGYRLCGELMTDLVFERKNSLKELSANIGKYRERFEREMERAASSNTKLVMLIENDSLDTLFGGAYNTGMKVDSYVASLLTYQERYGIEIQTIGSGNIGQYIYKRFYYHVRELIVKGGTYDSVRQRNLPAAVRRLIQLYG